MLRNKSNALPIYERLDEPLDWRADLKGGLPALVELVELGHVSPKVIDVLHQVAKTFKFRVSRYYLSLVDWSDPACPIKRQAIPDLRELDQDSLELKDPTGDLRFRVNPLLIHRYPDRVLLTPTLLCPMYCRYCFRKVGLNGQQPSFIQHWEEALAYLRSNPSIEEVILSGGDPLLLSDRQLNDILKGLTTVPSVQRIRIHTRVPVTLPSRLTQGLMGILKSHSPLMMVTHFNHYREITPLAVDRIEALRAAGVVLFNQTVLLKGINDQVDVLRRLFKGLINQGVRPYYLHHTDLTVGTHHFRVSLDDGLNLYRRLRGVSSGLSIPTYVMEIPDGGGKVVVDSGDVKRIGDGEWSLRSPITGVVVQWRDPAFRVERTVINEAQRGYDQ